MSTIQPISTTRVTDAMTRTRLTAQIQTDQLDLFRLQNQLSTGFRIFLPSDDAPAAQRAMVLQRTIERKEQSLTNLRGAENGLGTTEAGLAQLNTLLNDLRANALGAVGTFATQQERNNLASEIDLALSAIQRAGNTTFTSTYLVGGADRSSAPYEAVNGYIEYLGDESTPRTFVDIGQLFDSGTSGHDALGGFSEAVRGDVDLDLQLTPETRLSKLNGGLGVSANGSIEVIYTPSLPSEPGTSAVIDLSSAETIEDVAQLIEAQAPEGSGLVVSVQGNALRIDATDGGVTVNESAGGQTARELGIVSNGTPAATLVGTDLNPSIDRTDRLDDLGGTKARGRIVAPGANNDLVLTADQNGDLTGITINYIDGAAGPGSESASYDDVTNTLTVTIAEGDSTAIQIAEAINSEPTVPFTAELDYRDQLSPDARGTGQPPASPTDNLAVGFEGGSGGQLDFAAGLLVTNGDETYTIDTSAMETVEDLLSELNRPDYGLMATLNATGDGIDVRTRRSGADFAIAENGGTTASDLGIRTYTAESRLADFNRGEGVIVPFDTDEATQQNNSFAITVVDQGVESTHEIDLTAATSVQDVLDRIEAAVPNFDATVATTGNGISLTRTDAVDPAAPASGTFAITGGTFDLTTIDTGVDANQADIDIVIVDGTTPGAEINDAGDVITVTVDITNDPANATIQSVADQITTALGGQFTVSNVTGGTTLATAETRVDAGSLTGGYDADEFTVSGSVAERLGFIPDGETSVTSTGATLQSEDRNTREVDSVFTTLIRMRDALLEGDDATFESEVNRLDTDIDRVTFSRAEIGARLQNLDAIETRLVNEEVTLRSALSEEIDADLVEVISDFTAKQASLQASLQISGTLLNLSILDFI
ncbi:MAG: hypothetical protein AAF266_09855 [Planctomycetota bacterium]